MLNKFKQKYPQNMIYKEYWQPEEQQLTAKIRIYKDCPLRMINFELSQPPTKIVNTVANKRF